MPDNDLAGEIRQALEDTTPGPWEWVEQYDYLVTEDGSYYVIATSARGGEIIADRHDRALIAAAPDLLARAAARIEQLEARAPKPDSDLLHCIDHLSNDVDEGWRMNWASNDDLRAILEYLDLVIAKEGA